MDADIIVPITFFLFLAAVILVPGYLRSKEQERLHKTLRLAYEKGQPVPPEMIEALQTNRMAPQPDRDLRRGIVLLCVAALQYQKVLLWRSGRLSPAETK